MKLRQIALYFIGLAATPAFAQNSVTLYGVIDEGLDYTNNSAGHSAYQLTSGYAQGSRWGLKGLEDLGGGLHTVFTLENGFNASNGTLGQGGRMFGRQAFVGLTDDQFGNVYLGRQYDSVVDYLAPLTANGGWAGYLFDHPYDADNTDNTFRENNAVKYSSPNLLGFRFGGTYAFSNDTNFSNDRSYSFGSQYANGGLLISAAYLQANNPGSTSAGALASNNSTFIAGRLRIFGAGATYKFDQFSVAVSYTNTTINTPAPSGTNLYIGSIEPLTGGTITALKFQNFEINGTYKFTPAFFVGAMYLYTAGKMDATSGNGSPNYNTVGLMADYNLSKRTDVYMQGVVQRVVGGKTSSILDRASVLGGAGVSSTPNQAVLRIALRERF